MSRSLYQVSARFNEMQISPNISPIRLSASDSFLLSMSYDNLSSMLPLHTALDAPSLVFFAAYIAARSK